MLLISSALNLLWFIFLLLETHECEANCPPLSLRNGGISYRKGSLVDGKYTVGTSAFMFCHQGFSPSAPNNQRYRFCRDNGWSHKSMTCDATCFAWNAPANGAVSYDKSPINNRYPAGTEATFTCNPGYNQEGRTSATCRSSPTPYGRVTSWIGPSGTPKCTYIPNCPPLNLANGKVRYDPGALNTGNYRVDAVAAFSCNDGYSLSHSNHRVCLSSERWRGTNPRRDKDYPDIGVLACFPSEARVLTENGKSVVMSKLQIGDRVQTVSSNGSLTYTEVIAFMKRQPNVIINYKSITTLSQKSLTLSANHLVYGRTFSNAQFNPMYADQVCVGDEVLVKENGNLVSEKVVNVSNIIMPGAYVPMTTEGNILVEAILASCYASVNHDLVHFGMTPMDGFQKWSSGFLMKKMDFQLL